MGCEDCITHKIHSIPSRNFFEDCESSLGPSHSLQKQFIRRFSSIVDQKVVFRLFHDDNIHPPIIESIQGNGDDALVSILSDGSELAEVSKQQVLNRKTGILFHWLPPRHPTVYVRAYIQLRQIL